MSQLRFVSFLLIVVLSPLRMPAQDQQEDPQFRIQVDVAGKAIDDTKAAEKKKKTDWIELRSKNFLVVGDADLEDIRQAASEAELFRYRFAQLFPRAGELSSVPNRIVVFRDRRSIRQFGPLEKDGVGGDHPSFQSGSDVNYLVLTAGDQLSHDMIRGLVRELARDSITPVPLWFQEALGEYFSSYQLGRMGKNRVIKMGLDDYKQKLKEKELIPLSVLFSISPEDFEAMDSETKKFFISESCSLFEYLLQNRRITATLQMINGMAEGEPAAESFRNAFKLSFPTFEENFKRHIQYSKLHGWNVAFTALSLDPNTPAISIFYANEPRPMRLPTNFDSIRAAVEVLPVRLLTEAQAEMYRGDLLLHSNRLDEAEGHLRNAIELDDKLAATFASLAEVKTAEHDYTGAQDLIDKSLELDPNNYLAYFYDAALLLRQSTESGIDLSDEELQEMQAALTRSVKIAPEFVESSEMLAETQRRMRSDLSSATTLLLNGLKRAPGRESLLMEMAKVAAEGGEQPTAGWLLQRIVFSGTADARMKRDARDLLSRLNLSPDQKAAFKEFAADDAAGGGDPGVAVRLVSKKDRKNLVNLEKSENPGEVIRTVITKVDCAKGMTIYVRMGTRGADERIENLHSDTPERIDWVTDTGQTMNFIGCGETPIRGRVAITYRPARKGLMMGEPLVVEILNLPE